MSGTRQHFIPRFLQRGFAADPSVPNPMTIAYRKGQVPFLVATSNVGLERFFYSEDGDTSLDDTITAAEHSYSKLVVDLRSGPSGTVNSDLIGEFLAHLEQRTRHLRVTFADTTTYLLDQILSRAADPEWFGAYASRALAENPLLLRRAVEEELHKRGVPQVLLEPILAVSQPLIPQFMPSIAVEASLAAASLLPTISAKLSAAAKSGHLKALSRSLASPAKAQVYSELTYTIHDVPFALPLGDSLTLIQVDGPRRFKPFFEKGDDLVAVYLPLTASKVLVGSAPHFGPPLSELPSAVVRSSVEFFVHPHDSPELRRLQPEIGTNSHLMTKVQLDAMIGEVFGDGP